MPLTNPLLPTKSRSTMPPNSTVPRASLARLGMNPATSSSSQPASVPNESSRGIFHQAGMLKQKDGGQHGLLALLKQERDSKAAIGRTKDGDRSAKAKVLNHLQKEGMSFKEWLPQK